MVAGSVAGARRRGCRDDFTENSTACPGLDPKPISPPADAMKDGCWVYILASRRRGTLYVGVTANLPRRIWEHREGVAASFTRTYGVKRLVLAEHYDSIKDAREREHRIKRWRRQWKIELIETANPDWDDLFDRLNR
jgi:putative endonuclease